MIGWITFGLTFIGAFVVLWFMSHPKCYKCKSRYPCHCYDYLEENP